MLTPPNICTFLRVILVPLFCVLWFTAHQYASICTASVFILASVTDWLDGYLARKVGAGDQGWSVGGRSRAWWQAVLQKAVGRGGLGR